MRNGRISENDLCGVADETIAQRMGAAAVKIPGSLGRPLAALLSVVLIAGGALAGPAAAADPGEASHRAAPTLVPRLGVGWWPWAGRAGIRASALPANGLPEPGVRSGLLGTFCISPANCWAVGGYGPPPGNSTRNEVLHWSGSAWAQVSAPSPAGTVSDLFAVRCRKASDCWAVGSTRLSSSAVLNEALHWNGRKWSQVSVPDPGGRASGSGSELFDMACPSAFSCWAVGFYGHAGATLNQMLHWNGRNWRLVRAPDPGGTTRRDTNALFSIRCISATSCLAAGSYRSAGGSENNQVLHWNGAVWSRVRAPSPGGTRASDFSDLLGLACSSATSCWAAGEYGTLGTPETLLNQVLRWNGRTWSQVAVPEPGGTGSGSSQELHSASCTSAANCWAAGDYVPSGGDTLATLNLALHWNGRTWSQVVTPNPGGFAAGDDNELRTLSCTSSTNCWAVGFSQAGIGGPELGEALHWNGTSWSAA